MATVTSKATAATAATAIVDKLLTRLKECRPFRWGLEGLENESPDLYRVLRRELEQDVRDQIVEYHNDAA